MAGRRGLMQSESVQNFLKSLLTLQRGSELVSTSAMAEILQISAPSVTDMTQRLEEAGLVSWRKWRGFRLTASGETEALMILRRHRLIELFLVEELGYELPEVHAEAERLEHAVSDRFIEAIARRMHEPGLDPHGDPIPAPDGTILRRRLRPLSEWPAHKPATVSRILTRSEGNAARHRRLRHHAQRSHRNPASLQGSRSADAQREWQAAPHCISGGRLHSRRGPGFVTLRILFVASLHHIQQMQTAIDNKAPGEPLSLFHPA